eukprot:m.238091 g.238091  ORF g.238091 m.238091 type:complete len:1248 (+) comp33718_c0_seq1:60-3803(+)
MMMSMILRPYAVVFAIVGSLVVFTDSFDTSSLDSITFYSPSVVRSSDVYRTTVVSLPSLNAGLWAAANSTVAETPFSKPDHVAGMETVLNLSASGPCTTTYSNISNINGVATLPIAQPNTGIFLGIAYGLTYDECVSHCCSSIGCQAWAWYSTTDEGLLCQTYTAGFGTGPQPWPQGHVITTQGGRLTVAASEVDDVANGLRSGAHLGGAGTGGYEMRADGTFHLETIRNQSPSAEPWQGIVRDAVLAVSVNGQPNVVRLKPFGNISGVPQLVYSNRFPIAKLEFLNMSLFAYSPLTPGDTNSSNTPAVVFTLHVVNQGSAPMDVSFMVLRGLGLRNDWNQVSAKAVPVAASSRSDCCAACVHSQPCYAWQWDVVTSTCLLDRSGYAQGANKADMDSGFPGSYSFGAMGVTFTTSVVPDATLFHNALGSQALTALAGDGSDSGGVRTVGSGVAESVETLLATLTNPNPATALNAHKGGSGGEVFAATTISVTNVPVGARMSMSIAHTWFYPHYYWYRDRFSGSDNGVRYTNTFSTIDAVAQSLNLTQIAQNLVEWQRVYAGLPDPVLEDAAFNLFSHLRSSMWHKSGEYRQWESFEFADWSNPTNGDERHLNYFHVLPDAMRSRLLTIVRKAQDADGMFHCVVVSSANDNQFGSDPCNPEATGPAGHPDDITMVMVGAYEAYTMRNDTALIDEIYPALQLAFSYYEKHFDAAPWRVPYMVHETYDAVPQSAQRTGEGNYGSSLYNAVNYLAGLHCMREFAVYRGDTVTASQASSMIYTVKASLQQNFWSPGLNMYIGDTLKTSSEANSILLDTNEMPYHSNDGLHGQVLAYRLGFEDLLPRRQMELHQQYIKDDLATPWGLTYDSYAQQNWIMGDHSHTALLLRWNEQDAWNTSLAQIRYWRDRKRESTRHSAVVNTLSGQYGLLNYYGYALFWYHTLSAWTGQSINLPKRSLQFQPHVSAFNASGVATVPVLLGGDLGTLEITATTASLRMSFLAKPLSFLNVTICQHVFAATEAQPFAVYKRQTIRFALPTPCNSAEESSATSVVSTPYCHSDTPVSAQSLQFSQGSPLPVVQGVATLEDCTSYALVHRFCGYMYTAATNSCTLAPGTACALVPRTAPAPPSSTIAVIKCNYSSVYTTPAIVNTTAPSIRRNVSFGPSFSYIDSAVFSFVTQNVSNCLDRAVARQVCGWMFAPSYTGASVGSCSTATHGCCFLNPYRGCDRGLVQFQEWGGVSVGVFALINSTLL